MYKKQISNLNDDKEIWHAINNELKRQEEHIELIASENYVTKNVMLAQGSHLTNKYAEGYPNNRYYSGCEYIDVIEQLAIDRAKILFDADFVNVQPHSGSQANAAVYMALLDPGDTILGMNLIHGGHLSHGSSVNFSGKFYRTVTYGVDTNGYINYEDIKYQADKYKPKMIVAGFSSYSRIIDWAIIRQIADSVNAYLLVDIAHVAGLIVTNIYPNPINYAHVVTSTTHKTLAGPRGGIILAKNGNEEFYKKLNLSMFPGIQGGPLMHVIAAKAIAFKEAMMPEFKLYQQQVVINANVMANIFMDRGYMVVSGGTDNHLFLLNLTNKHITAKLANQLFSQANIIVNENYIPNNIINKMPVLGIRIGTPAVTRRGLKEKEITSLTHWMCDILDNTNNTSIIGAIKQKILNICRKFPVYQENSQ
uniref:Serine hydroxymethyltransferase n=1 Tax=Candidatus Aschnera chinzeii TaxID=1485666 RepID=A0AAT9G4N1_9ENTR|nr:MAG: serine hydroxymethyltransferase [Candidatus Aschnera chinzeii]